MSGELPEVPGVKPDLSAGHEEIYNQFWRFVVEDGDGNLSLDQVKRELADFYRALHTVPRVYDHVTGGKVSKILTDPSVVTGLADEYYDDLHHPSCDTNN